ncbi:MAG: oligosaccharide flippase family protein [Anaerovibrio sp.]|nr:oligosaccharide flippase family protein [Anaerovibrio sp.]
MTISSTKYKLKNRKNMILKNSFFKNILLLSSGSIIAQIINFVTVPFMTRFFSTEDIGMFTYITTISYLFTPIICLRYETAIILEQNNTNVCSLVKLCMIISTVLSIVICGGYYTYFILSEKTELLEYMLLLVFLLLVSGIINILTSYNTRNQEYKLLSKVSIVRSVTNMFLLLYLGYMGTAVHGLLTSHVVSQLMGLKEQSSSLIRDKKKIIYSSWHNVFSMVTKYRGLPIYSVPAIFLNNISYLAINFFIAELYGMEQLGYYALSNRVLGVPLTMIGYNVGNVFFEKASKQFEKTGSFSSTYIETFRLLVVLSIPIIGGIYFLAPWFCEFYLGSEWYVAGMYIRIMCIMFALKFIFSPLTAGIMVLKKNKIEMLCQLCFFIVSIIVYLVSMYVYVLSIEEFLFVISIGFAFVYLVFGVIIFKLS